MLLPLTGVQTTVDGNIRNNSQLIVCVVVPMFFVFCCWVLFSSRRTRSRWSVLLSSWLFVFKTASRLLHCLCSKTVITDGSSSLLFVIVVCHCCLLLLFVCVVVIVVCFCLCFLLLSLLLLLLLSVTDGCLFSLFVFVVSCLLL